MCEILTPTVMCANMQHRLRHIRIYSFGLRNVISFQFATSVKALFVGERLSLTSSRCRSLNLLRCQEKHQGRRQHPPVRPKHLKRRYLHPERWLQLTVPVG